MPIPIDFTKGQGAGNDFVLFADPDGRLDLSDAQYAALADRHFGIGADGVIRVVRSAHLPEGVAALAEEPAAEWFMDYRNADGSRAEMCGNGVRVFARFLLENGLADIPHGHALPVGTRAGVRDVQQSATGFQVDLGRWHRDAAEVLVRTRGQQVARPSVGIDVGNPHLVVALADSDELADLDLDVRPLLDPEPPRGANIEFVVPAEPLVKDGIGRITMRVFERGVGETLACGTGVAAAALATRHWAGAQAPDHWQVRTLGGLLGVRMFPTEEGEHVSLSGPAELVYSGTITID